jgi:hypothetical protein
MTICQGLDSTGGILESWSPAGVRFDTARSIDGALIFSGRKLDSVGLTRKNESSRIKDVAGFPLDSARLLQGLRQVFLASPGRVQHDEPSAGRQIGAHSNG